MTDTHLKTLVFAFVLVAAILAGAIYLSASPLSSATPAPSAAPVAASTAEPTIYQSSTQPKITWSATSTEVTLPPGGSTSQQFTFTSNTAIQNLVLEPVPEIAGFVTIQPKTFANVPAWQPLSVNIAFSIPASTTLGTYHGTIHARNGSTTLPQTLKLTINAWNRLTDAAIGISVFFPPSLYNLTDTNSPPNSFDLESSPNGVVIGGGAPVGSTVATSGFAIGIDAKPYDTSGGFDVTQYLAAEYPNSAADASTSPITVGGAPGYEIFFVGEETGNWPVVVVYHDGYIYRFLYSSTDYNSGFSDQSGFNAFNEVLAHLTFSQ